MNKNERRLWKKRGNVDVTIALCDYVNFFNEIEDLVKLLRSIPQDARVSYFEAGLDDFGDLNVTFSYSTLETDIEYEVRQAKKQLRVGGDPLGNMSKNEKLALLKALVDDLGIQNKAQIEGYQPSGNQLSEQLPPGNE